jgi:hypothetical protein
LEDGLAIIENGIQENAQRVHVSTGITRLCERVLGRKTVKFLVEPGVGHCFSIRGMQSKARNKKTKQ